MTKVANTLAFAMKSTAEKTTEFGQMYGNFSAEAARLGKVPFAEQLAGKMVYMRKNGTEMGTIKDLMEGARGVGLIRRRDGRTTGGAGATATHTLGTEASSATRAL
ncbi:Uncharacterised protein [Citrobacter koseri]|nr:Uncharacterised protein [Citrobacter koseri]